ncbi:methyltransferase [Thermococcus guaymasensis DSM 11113]|uniref:Methyltransferase n=1 Tax=Thermococcus guaymasensis DSM 11113 TaxID=1432656 RepID=A0A0X1KJI5_9EURY|nr:hypothetical protein [Thermococcus guaymasensis]AJC71434.1 methyltransferase [Thermococcus guaymasensis DSM 11113]
MKRYIIVGVAALLVFLAGVHLGVSYFSDVAKSSGNEVSTGDFDIGISKDGKRFYDDYKLFSFDNLAPGESRTFTFYVKNRGDYPVSSVGLLFNVTDLEDGSLSKAEALVDNTPEVGELSEYLTIADFRVEVNGTDTALSNYIGKTLREVNMSELSIFNGLLKPDEQIKVTITIKLSPSAGNECLTDSADVGLIITASQ